MHYRSLQDLNADVRRLAEGLPAEIDLVVGIPRSGLLAANLLCLYLDVPLTDVDGLCGGRVLQTGRRYDEAAGFPRGDSGRVLVLDDSVDSGAEMTRTKDRLARSDVPFDLEYAAVYVSPDGYYHVDHWVDVVARDRVFEWNLLHHPHLEQTCVDVDGVLCRDPTPAENDDGKEYREFLETVDPKVIPSRRIGWLVTCRLEQYRDVTERWLADHGVEYGELVMMDYQSKAARQRAGTHAEFKADVYDRTGAKLFVESDPAQATAIARETGKSVYCYDTREMVQPGGIASVQASTERYLDRLASDPVGFSTTATKFALSRGYHTLNRVVRSLK